MRIAYVVDVHGRFESVGHALERIGPVDVLVIGGDITTFGSPDDVERAVGLWRPLAPRLLAVAGNCDSPAIDTRLVELGISLHGRGVEVGDVGLAGASASPVTPLDTPYELTDDEFAENAAQALRDVAASRIRILCPHAPPSETACDRLRSGNHVGSPALRSVIEREQPDLVLCGHIHEGRGTDSIGRTQIVNPGPVASGHFAVVEAGDELAVELDR